MAMARDDLGRGLSLAARIGVELAVTLLVGGFLGYLLDRWLSTLPWFMLVGLLLGTIAGFRGVYRVLSREEEKSKKG
jgi:ATP synthase protein I